MYSTKTNIMKNIKKDLKDFGLALVFMALASIALVLIIENL